MIVGIDPGASGAIAWLDDFGNLSAVEDMPSIEVKVGKGKRTRVSGAMLAEVLRSRGPVLHAFVERVGAMPGQGTASMFAFGYSAGMIEGALSGLGVPFTFVTPQKWKGAMHLPIDKGSARMRAGQLWPAMAREFARVKDDGRAEAAMIGLYGANTLQGVGTGPARFSLAAPVEPLAR